MAGLQIEDALGQTAFQDRNGITQFTDQDGDFLGTGIVSGINCDAGSYALTGQSVTLVGGSAPAVAVLMPMGCM